MIRADAAHFEPHSSRSSIARSLLDWTKHEVLGKLGSGCDRNADQHALERTFGRNRMHRREFAPCLALISTPYRNNGASTDVALRHRRSPTLAEIWNRTIDTESV